MTDKNKIINHLSNGTPGTYEPFNPEHSTSNIEFSAPPLNPLTFEPLNLFEHPIFNMEYPMIK